MNDSYLVELVSNYPCLYDPKCAVYKDQNIKDNVWKTIAEKTKQPVEECKKRWKNIRDTYNRRKKNNKSTGSARSQTQSKWYLSEAVSFLNKVEQERKSISNIDGPIGREDAEREKETGKSDSEEPDQNAPQTSQIRNDNEHDMVYDEHEELSNKMVDTETDGEMKNDIKSKKSKQTESTKSFVGPAAKRQKLTDKVLGIMTKNSEERHKWMQKAIEKKSEERFEEHPIDIFFKSMSASVKKLSQSSQIKAKMEICRIVGDLELQELSRPSSSMSQYTYGNSSEPRSNYSYSSCTPEPSTEILENPFASIFTHSNSPNPFNTDNMYSH